MTDIVQILKEMQQEEDCPIENRRDSFRHRGGTGEAQFG